MILLIDSIFIYVLIFKKMADKASILKNAQNFLAKGQVDKAIAEGEKLVKSFPDSNTFNFLGDLYLKKGDKQKACETYHRTAKVFRDDGFSLKALAIYKKILNLDPSDANALRALGELNEEKNIAADAIKFYLAAADSFFKNKKKEDALKVYERILRLAPQNIPLRTKIAEMITKQGFSSQAAEEYRNIGHVFVEKGDLEKAKDSFIKSLDVQPGSRKTMLALSDIAQKTGDLAQAMNYVKIAIERTGEHPDLLLRNAVLLIEKGSYDEAQGMLEKILADSPDNIEARKARAELFAKQGDKEKAWEIFDPLLDDMIIAGQLDEAKDILLKFRDKNPIEMSRKLITIYKNTGENEAAARETLTLAETYESRGMMHEAMTTYNEARALQPDNSGIMEKIEGIKRQLQPGEPELPEMSGVPGGEEVVAKFDAPAAEGAAITEEAMTEIDVLLRYGLNDEARQRLDSMKLEHPDNIEVHQKLKTLFKNTDDVNQAVTECMVLAELLGREGDEENRKANIKEAFELNPSDPRLEGKLEEVGISQEEAEEEVAVESDESPHSHESEIAEADFYEKQGFYKEAADVYERLISQDPDNSELRAKLDNVRNSMEEPAPAADETEGTETLSFDDLFAESESSAESVEPALDSEVLEVFEEFKRGLEDQVEAGDTETHYNLGIAYKEMGLLDDAISTFQAASKDPNFFVQASNMLGTCYMEKGLYSLAVKAYSGVLQKIDPGDETAWSIKYDLAEALEHDGKSDEALRYYTEVYGWNSSFREVADKINALNKPARPTASKPAAAEPASTEPVVSKPEAAAPKAKEQKESTSPKRKSRVSYI